MRNAESSERGTGEFKLRSHGSFPRRDFLLLLSASITFWTAQGILTPVIPLYIRSFGASMTDVGLIAMTRALGFAVFEPITGWLSDRIGRKRLLIFSTLSTGGVLFAYTLIMEVWSFYLVSFIIASTMSCFSSPMRASMAETIPESSRGKGYGVYMMLLSLGSILGPLIGGYVTDLAGYTIPFYIGILVILASFFLMLNTQESLQPQRTEPSLIINENNSLEQDRSKGMKGLLTLGFVLFLTSRFIYMFNFSFTNSFLPILAKESPSYKLSKTDVGVLMAVISATTGLIRLPSGVLVERFGRKSVIISGLILNGFSFFGFLTASGFVQLCLVVVLMAMGTSATDLGMIVLLTDVVPRRKYGAAIGLYGLSEDIGIMACSAVTGFFYDTMGIAAVVYFLSAFIFGDVILSIVSFKALKRNQKTV